MNNDLKFQQSNEDDNSEIDDLYPSVKNAVINVAKKEGYVYHNLYKKMITADGGNCFGVLYEIDIKGETIKGIKQETNLFIKQVIPKGDDIKLLSISEIFNKEVFIYTDLAKIFTELQDKVNVPMKKRFKLVKMYDESNVDAIILENMTKLGFQTYGKLEIMNLNYAELCVEHLAKFHGLAFLIERWMPEYFENKIKIIKQSLVIDSTYKKYANKIYELATRKLSSELKVKTDKWWQLALDNYSKYVRGTMTAVKCLCHGDFKTNNVMYKQAEGKITEVIAVDYQLAHYGSPILDLIYFICMGTDQEFRREHLNHLKDYYHLSLKKYLDYFDVLVDDVYPKKMFEKDFEDCLDYALVTCICVLPISLTTEDGVPDLVNTEIIHVALKFNDTYYDRLEGVFDDFFKWDG